MRPRLMAMVNEAKKQIKAKRKNLFGKCPKTLMMSPKQAHFYLASLSEDQKALLHYCDRTSPAFILPSSTSPMIAMPYVFPAAELLLANKFYLRSLITQGGNPKKKLEILNGKDPDSRFCNFWLTRSDKNLFLAPQVLSQSKQSKRYPVHPVHFIPSHFLLRSPIKP